EPHVPRAAVKAIPKNPGACVPLGNLQKQIGAGEVPTRLLKPIKFFDGWIAPHLFTPVTVPRLPYQLSYQPFSYGTEWNAPQRVGRGNGEKCRWIAVNL